MAGTDRNANGLWGDANWTAGVPGAGVTWDLKGYDVTIIPGYTTEEVGDGGIEGGSLTLLDTAKLDVAGLFTVNAADDLIMHGGSAIRVVCSSDDQSGRGVVVSGLTSCLTVVRDVENPAKIYSKDNTKRAQRGLYLQNPGPATSIDSLEVYDFSDIGVDMYPAYILAFENVWIHDCSSSTGHGIYVRYCRDIPFRNVCVSGCKFGLTLTYGSVSLYNCRFGEDLDGNADENTYRDLNVYDGTVRGNGVILASSVIASAGKHNDVFLIANLDYNAADGIIEAKGTPGTDFAKVYGGEVTEAASKRVLTPNSNCGTTAPVRANYKAGGLGFHLPIPATAGDVISIVLKATATTDHLECKLDLDPVLVSGANISQTQDIGTSETSMTVTGTVLGSSAEKVLVAWEFNCQEYQAGAYVTIDGIEITVNGIVYEVEQDRWALLGGSLAAPVLALDSTTTTSAVVTFSGSVNSGVSNRVKYTTSPWGTGAWLAGGSPRNGDGDVTISGLTPGTRYYFVGYSVYAGLWSAVSNLVVATPGTVVGFEAMANAIRGAFDTQIADTYPSGLDVQYDNDGAFVQPEDSAWVRFAVLPGESFQMTLGTQKRYRTPGLAVASIFVPVGVGDKAAYVIADYIADRFRTITLNGVTFKTPSVASLGRSGDVWQVNVRCPFTVDTIV